MPARQSVKHAMFTRNGNSGPFAEITSNVRERVLFGYFLTSTISERRSNNSRRRIMSDSLV